MSVRFWAEKYTYNTRISRQRTGIRLIHVLSRERWESRRDDTGRGLQLAAFIQGLVPRYRHPSVRETTS
jgi:hypothetical protein